MWMTECVDVSINKLWMKPGNFPQMVIICDAVSTFQDIYECIHYNSNSFIIKMQKDK